MSLVLGVSDLSVDGVHESPCARRVCRRLCSGGPWPCPLGGTAVGQGHLGGPGRWEGEQAGRWEEHGLQCRCLD